MVLISLRTSALVEHQPSSQNASVLGLVDVEYE